MRTLAKPRGCMGRGSVNHCNYVGDDSSRPCRPCKSIDQSSDWSSREEDNVRRRKRAGWIVTGIGATTLIATLTVTGSMAASAASTHGSQSLLLHALPRSGSAGTVVTAGSTWTLYALYGGNHQSCLVMSPGARKVFTDDKADAGKWKSSARSTSFSFTTGGDKGIFFKDTWVSADGYWDGNFEYAGNSYGPEILVQGDDPWNWGSC